ncbi:methionine ABC transporter ATP-binding protein [Corynebacterium uberis]|uniref:ATP-binding cassette domain-containing protein n=1 Tax=Corynebacterium TaxID=1716 RepID=UPI001D09AD79|nr:MULTISPECIES: ATP-binding cassette domain-containing protein [Corynebacterium]MCZ9308986.1 methionine ABC transporter ATP-binding protein [Corynebacterium sp. c6VSa_13]UDL74545.1 methionine ABC transporter ATP-binding protein [Corynebacterium uberis]UDL76621.1 methionine ABC transporter ATP-binding protein [Corynebacterium uberis]UDL78834.1 methionine ABC transporter ATP-binding protein [Corynebacterium uberis]UDL81112.1 methionine ABC transporter ATP-binding protein [Corynebacterium uberis
MKHWPTRPGVYLTDAVGPWVPAGVIQVAADVSSEITGLRARVDEEVAFGLEQRGWGRAEMTRRVAEVIDVLGLSSLVDRDPRELSGGQTRLVAIGAAAVVPEVGLLIEHPWAGLDPESVRRVRTLCRLRAEQSGTVVLVCPPRPRLGRAELPAWVEPGAPVTLSQVSAQRGAVTLGPVDVELRRGAVTWLTGANGAGKSTLLRELALTHGAALSMQRSVDQVVDHAVGRMGIDAQTMRMAQLAADAHPLDLEPSALRVAMVAAALARGTAVVCLDEPDVDLDAAGRAVVHRLLAQALRQQVAVVIACHEDSFMSEVASYCQVTPVEVDSLRRPAGRH